MFPYISVINVFLVRLNRHTLLFHKFVCEFHLFRKAHSCIVPISIKPIGIYESLVSQYLLSLPK